MAKAIRTLANNSQRRREYGRAAQKHIRRLANSEETLDRLERALNCASTGADNPSRYEDWRTAVAASDYLNLHQYGHSVGEAAYLRFQKYRVGFHHWRKMVKARARNISTFGK
jgi:hypothetical protein